MIKVTIQTLEQNRHTRTNYKAGGGGGRGGGGGGGRGGGGDRKLRLRQVKISHMEVIKLDVERKKWKFGRIFGNLW